MIDNCKFCNGPFVFERATLFDINNKTETIDVESCAQCKTPFNVAETYAPKSKHRVFKKLISRDVILEEFTFDDGLSLDNDYSEHTSYVGKYIFNGKIITRTGKPYRSYTLVTAFNLFDVSQIPHDKIYKKLKLYLTFL